MVETQYGIIKATPSLPARDLISVPHKKGILVVSYPAFGPDNYSNNLKEMQRQYSHSKELPKISFREPATSESISAAAYDFKNRVKPEIFDPRWLQVGRIVRTSEGVFANPPVDKQGNPITDEKTLKSILNKSEKVNEIYLSDNDFGFAPYETFNRGVQDCHTFAQGGLARILEYTEEKEAENLRTIASPKFYKRGVNVWGFDDVKEPILRVASLGSGRGLGSLRLFVGGDGWDGGSGGFAFGVLDSGEASAKK